MGTHGNILIVDDDPVLRDAVALLLSEAGYAVTKAANGRQAVCAFEGRDFDLAIVDLRLSDADGLALIRTLKEKSDVAVVILSGLGEVTDRVIGLEVGADDYVAKPFDPRELLARVRSVLRRTDRKTRVTPAEPRSYVFEGWELDVSRMNLTSPTGEPVKLTSGEFSLLKALVEHPNMVLSRNQLLDHTHRHYTPAFDRSVDVQIGRLRKRIEKNPRKPQIIKTIHNAGYIFTATIVPS